MESTAAEIQDPKQIRARYRVFKSLKINTESILKSGVTDTGFRRLIDNLTDIYHQMKALSIKLQDKYSPDAHAIIPLSRDKLAVFTVRPGKVNFFVVDMKNHTITQTISFDEAKHLVQNEASIIRKTTNDIRHNYMITAVKPEQRGIIRKIDEYINDPINGPPIGVDKDFDVER